MKICVNCRKEMKCTKTGRTAVFCGNHCYPGDEFTCKSCGMKVLVCNSNPYHSADILQKSKPECVLEMPSEEIEP